MGLEPTTLCTLDRVLRVYTICMLMRDGEGRKAGSCICIYTCRVCSVCVGIENRECWNLAVWDAVGKHISVLVESLLIYIYMLMRDEGRKKQAWANRQQSKATQHTVHLRLIASFSYIVYSAPTSVPSQPPPVSTASASGHPQPYTGDYISLSSPATSAPLPPLSSSTPSPSTSQPTQKHKRRKSSRKSKKRSPAAMEVTFCSDPSLYTCTCTYIYLHICVPGCCWRGKPLLVAGAVSYELGAGPE